MTRVVCACRRSWARHDRGQATVELALVVPVIASLALVIVQIAVIARDQILTVHAAREAARAASVDRNPQRGIDAAHDILPGAQVDIGSRPAVGQLIAVRVRYRASTSVPIIGALVPDVELHARTMMAVER